jgi:hypothetical protein
MRSALFVLLLVSCELTLVNSVLAQSWSLSRTRPSLFEIVAVDRTDAALWPFGQEDIAGDGLATVKPDEAAVDLRSLYADARAQRLWLRAYVAAKVAPDASALTFFFIDSDARAGTGGKASDTKLWPSLSADPSLGGYERAIALRGDGTLTGVYIWDTDKRQWIEQSNPARLVTPESGVDRDPLRLVGDEHGYVQVQLDLDTAGLDEACAANLFVRTWNDDSSGKRSFGDALDVLAVSCRPRLNAFGDPVILQSDVCTSDASCPAAGRCRDGVCLFGYECSADAACRSGEHCTSQVCVRVGDEDCDKTSDCDGLVCAASRCAACSDTGARACESGRVCAPDGTCLDPAARSSSSSNNGRPGERVRGGAFICATQPGGARVGAAWLALGFAALGAWHRRRRLRGKRPDAAAQTTNGGER